MIRIFCWLLIFAAVSVVSAGEVVLVKPGKQNPATQLGADELQQRYDELWVQFAQAVKLATQETEAELAKQSQDATKAGNLDLALFWRGLTEEFSSGGQLRWNAESLEPGWAERFGGSKFPKSFLPVLTKAQKAYAAAGEMLANGYAELEVDLTKAGLLDQALALREEKREIVAGPGLGQEPGQPNQQKNEPGGNEKKQASAKAIDLMPFVQLEGPGTTGVWKRVGRTIQCGTKGAVKTSIKFEVPAEFDFGCRFVVVQGGQVNMMSSFPASTFSWEMRMWPQSLPVLGFWFDGKSGKSNRTTMTWPEKLPNGGVHESVVRVRRDGVDAMLDGKVVSRVERVAMPQLGMNESWQVGENRLGLSCWDSTVTFGRIYLIPVASE